MSYAFPLRFNAVWRNLITLITFFDEICLDCFVSLWIEKAAKIKESSFFFPPWWIVLHKTILDLRRENSAQAGTWLHVFIETWKGKSAGDMSVKHGGHSSSLTSIIYVYLCINDTTRCILLIVKYSKLNYCYNFPHTLAFFRNISLLLTSFFPTVGRALHLPWPGGRTDRG